ncbi:Single-stranded DNA-binding protein [Zostera marina]|uniref:Single-stranded DNA-binding protein n=1 Tax=Zostera marina TaxID=29655 RepID=A0A0K9NWZ7_ZOSMR|nr:Single-stranded DNA-binding protein [Zostera marina]
MGVLMERLFRCFRVVPSTCSASPFGSLNRNMALRFFSASFMDPPEDNNEKEDDNIIEEIRELEPQGVDPKKGWDFRGVHKAIISGRVGQMPVQKILRNGRTVTVLTVGTGGMYDQRISRDSNLPRPAQWHRIVIHNEALGAIVVRQLVKNSPVFVEGDIETRVYNDSINGQIKNIPEICVRRDGKIRLIKTGEDPPIPLDDLKDGLF